MLSDIKRCGAAALLLLTAVAAEPSYGQNFIPGTSPFFQVRRGLTISQYAYNLALQGQALQNYPPYAFNNPYAASYANPYLSAYTGMYSNPYAAAYSAGNPYMTSYYDPYGLQGAAQLTAAQGNFMMDQQKALLEREKVLAERVKNQRLRFDEANYERERTPSTEEIRLRSLKEQVMRSRNNPPVTEIQSGKSLNDLLMDIRSVRSKGDSAELRTFQLPLSEETLRHINVTKGQGNIALLKNEGRLSWPVALSSVDFKEDREKINSLVRDAVSQAGFNGQVDSGTITQLISDTARMRTQLRRTGTDLPPSLYIEATSFLNNLNDAITALQQPNAGHYFTGKYALKAKTVPELVNYMTSQGLVFAPAVPGDEAAYASLQDALAAYDRAINPGIEKDLAARK